MTLKEQLQHKIDFKTKPTGSLGQLEDIALQVGLIQNTLSPEIKNPALLVFAADHGLANEKISAYPKEVTYQMALNFSSGGAAINVFCEQNNINLKVIDAGVDFNFPEESGIINAKIANGSKNMRHEPAMSVEECRLAMEKGAEFVKKEAETGCNTIAFGEMGIGNTSSSSLLMNKFTGLDIEKCTGRGSGLDEQAINRKIRILREISEKYSTQSPIEVLATFGGLEIAMMTGAILEAKKLKMIILVDGFIVTAATLTACKFNAEVRENTIFCHQSGEKGHTLLLENLNAEPILNLDMRLGEGTGAALALPIVQSAINFVNQMASFEDAGVSNRG
ncbi:MAG: nicotinate-nucleotide--dimethylbenzimidazole phosphoribosyltransferase [Bacteroidota bacterium]